MIRIVQTLFLVLLCGINTTSAWAVPPPECKYREMVSYLDAPKAMAAAKDLSDELKPFGGIHVGRWSGAGHDECTVLILIEANDATTATYKLAWSRPETGEGGQGVRTLTLVGGKLSFSSSTQIRVMIRARYRPLTVTKTYTYTPGANNTVLATITYSSGAVATALLEEVKYLGKADGGDASADMRARFTPPGGLPRESLTNSD